MVFQSGNNDFFTASFISIVSHAVGLLSSGFLKCRRNSTGLVTSNHYRVGSIFLGCNTAMTVVNFVAMMCIECAESFSKRCWVLTSALENLLSVIMTKLS